jgi:hypothetical protein
MVMGLDGKPFCAEAGVAAEQANEKSATSGWNLTLGALV